MSQISEALYAEDVGSYWKTSSSSADTWMDKTKSEIERFGGQVLNDGYGSDASGRAAFLITFKIGDEAYKVIWRVLPSKSNQAKSAKIQAATMMYHDIKAKCISARVLGARSAFFSYLLLPDGRTASEVATPELAQHLPKFLTSG